MFNSCLPPNTFCVNGFRGLHALKLRGALTVVVEQLFALTAEDYLHREA
jgi:hypothetical protein